LTSVGETKRQNSRRQAGKLFVDLPLGNEGRAIKEDAVPVSQRLDLAQVFLLELLQI
jgi:hypothetical protein